MERLVLKNVEDEIQIFALTWKRQKLIFHTAVADASMSWSHKQIWVLLLAAASHVYSFNH